MVQRGVMLFLILMGWRFLTRAHRRRRFFVMSRSRSGGVSTSPWWGRLGLGNEPFWILGGCLSGRARVGICWRGEIPVVLVTMSGQHFGVGVSVLCFKRFISCHTAALLRMLSWRCFITARIRLSVAHVRVTRYGGWGWAIG